MAARGERGFSLIEVILALALLAAALVSITGLFVMGSGAVESGRTASEALAVARDIHEELEAVSLRQTYEFFGYDGALTSYLIDTRTSLPAAAWQQVLAEKLPNAWATIALESLGPSTPPALESTRAIRVSVTVFWTEGARARSIDLAAVRM
jgi:prepilin-type N-terminal cleavage/methylation domain-containing protein